MDKEEVERIVKEQLKDALDKDKSDLIEVANTAEADLWKDQFPPD